MSFSAAFTVNLFKKIKIMSFSAAFTVNLFIKHIVAYVQKGFKNHIKAVSVRWYAFPWELGSDILFIISHLIRSISVFCQKAHHHSLKESISFMILFLECYPARAATGFCILLVFTHKQWQESKVKWGLRGSTKWFSRDSCICIYLIAWPLLQKL